MATVFKQRYIREPVQLGEPRVHVGGNGFEQYSVSHVTHTDPVTRQPELLGQPYGLAAAVAFSTPAEGMVLLLSSALVPMSVG